MRFGGWLKNNFIFSKQHPNKGGTLSPAFIFSTNRKFSNQVVTDIFHITDWFPTILDLAGFNPKKFPENLDGKSQRVTLQKSVYNPPRTKFIYGVIDAFDKTENLWKTFYTVRFGDFKYFNYNQPVRASAIIYQNLTKISVCRSKFRFLTKTFIFEQNCYFRPKFRFFTKISIFDLNFMGFMISENYMKNRTD